MKSLFCVLFFFLSTSTLFAQGGIVSWTVNGKEHRANTDTLFYRIATEGYTSEVQNLNLNYIGNILNHMPYDKQVEQAERFRQAGRKHKFSRLINEGDFIEIWFFPTPTDSLFSIQIKRMEKFVDRMEKNDEIEFALRGREFICRQLWHRGEYARPFREFAKMDKLMEQIPDVNKTGVNAASKKAFCNWFGDCYYQFKDYERAIHYFKRATDSIPPHLYAPFHLYDDNNLRARNHLGVHYRRISELDTSDYYFQSILEAPDSIKQRAYYDGLAHCNLGQNALKRKNYDKGIELMTQGLPSVLKYKHHGTNNYNFAGEVSISLGECYLMKHDFAKTKQMIDSARVFIQHANNTDHYGDLYSLMSKYIAHKNDPCLATAYMDSAVVARARTSEKYNSLIILRAEQEVFAVEQAETKLQQAVYRDRWLSISILAFVLLSGLTISLCLYYRKQQAYKLLVKRSLEWSQIPIAPLAAPLLIPSAEPNEIIDTKADKKLMKKVCKIVEKERLYSLADFTLADLAKRVGLATNELSKIGNRTMGMNYKTFINEYRIKEAVRIFSEESSPTKMEHLYREIGFKDRTSFYRSFKKVTGLSPSEFMKGHESTDESANQQMLK